RKMNNKIVKDVIASSDSEPNQPSEISKAPADVAASTARASALSRANRAGASDSAQRTTLGGIPLSPVYGPADTPGTPVPAPGEFPYTRGIHRDMYRGKVWTMRQFSGFATPEETNERYLYLLGQGQAGLSVAFDLPTLMGFDADNAT